MFVELAIGDAFGAGREYVDPNVPDYYTMTKMIVHPTHGLDKGQYTDDTQMTLGLVEYLIQAETLDERQLVGFWLNAFQRDKRLGYAKRFQEFLETHPDVESFMRDIKPDSDKSGGAMRVTPIGLIPDTSAVKYLADWQASITHNTTLGREAAVAAALAVHYCEFELGPLSQVGHWVNNEIKGEIDWSENWVGKVKSPGWHSSKAAITSLANNNSLTSMLKSCIDYTGDVDTVATIAIGAGSVSDQVVNDLPPELKFQLEKNGKYGIPYLTALEKKFREWIKRDGWKQLS